MDKTICSESILEAIDHIRNRKARPDLGRISRLLARKHGLAPWAVASQIERLMEEGKVVKVEYKGSVSYRNAAKWCRPTLASMPSWSKVPYNSGVLTATTTTTPSFTTSLAATSGMYSVMSYGSENKIVIRGCANRENLAEGFMQARTSLPKIGTVASQATENAKPADYTIRIKKKRGRPKTKISPTIIATSLSVPVSLLSEDKCDFCLSTATCNKYGLPEGLLKCKDCGAKAHPTCMNYGKELAARSRQYPWQCINCKVCSICEGLRHPELMLFCDLCDKGYHMDCHEPVVLRKPLGKWKCQQCIMEGSVDGFVVEEYGQNGGNTVLGDFSNSLNLVYNDVTASPKRYGLLNGYPDSVPNASNWSIEDVEEFIRMVGFPEQAHAFKEQEIDGKSLLLMKRSDVLTGLSIRLGPALKIYNHIKRLQMGKLAT